MSIKRPTEDKQRLRLTAKAFREKLNLQAISEKICSNLRTMEVFQNAKTVLAFYPMAKEIDISPLFSNSEKTWYLPRVEFEDDSQILRFFQYKQADKLIKSPFGVLEPSPDQAKYSINDPIDLILVPGLMFDYQGNRLGYGKAFYDRFLSDVFQTSEPNSKKYEPSLVGVVANDLLLPHLPSDLWDIPMNWVVTEQQCLKISRQK